MSCDGPYSRELSEMEGEYEAWLAAGSPPLGPSQVAPSYLAPMSLGAAPLVAMVEVAARPQSLLKISKPEVDITCPTSPAEHSPVSIFSTEYSPVFNKLDGQKPPLKEPTEMRQPQLMQWEPTK